MSHPTNHAPANAVRQGVHPMAAEIAGAMAQLMVKNGEAVTRDQLLDAGFTPAELNEHGEAARAEASRLIKRKAPPYDAFWPEPKEKDRVVRRRKARDTRVAARLTAASKSEGAA